MVKHIVLWKIRDDDQKQNNIDQMISMLTSLVGKIEGLVSMEMGYNFNTGSDYDVVLYATFKNAAALKYYQTHPEHIKCKDFVGSVSVGRTAADYFYEEGTKASRPFDEVPDAPEEFDINAAVKAAMKMSEGTPPTISVPDFSIPNKPIAPVVPAAPVEPVAPVVPAVPVEPVAPVVPDAPVEPVAPVVPDAPVEPETPAPTAATASNIKPENKKPKWSATPADFEPETSAPVTSSEPKTDRVETITEKRDIFGKKKLDVQVTPLDQRSDTWTCPKCGKIMPNYVGTCGCGEPKPFVFDEVPPAMQSAPTAKPAASDAPSAPAAPKAERVETITEKKDIFGKKKLDVQVTPLDQRSDTWTCPNCGKIMPNYVGTCGCGEPKPFVFDEVPPAMQSAPAAKPVAPAAPAAPKAERIETITEKKDIFGKKKLDVQVTPLDQRSDTWTCPNCGKIMPNYVGTCGCGEPKPFVFDDVPPAMKSAPAAKPAAPAATAAPATPKSERVETITEKKGIFGKKKLDVQVTPLDQRSDTWTCPNCGKIMPNYVGTCGCGEPKPFVFDDVPPAMQSAPAAKPAAPAATAAPATPKAERVETITEKKGIFSKKKLNVQVTPLDQRSDTWTCPKCGKIMPNYVGTCGCGEPKPFAFDIQPPAAPSNNMPKIKEAPEEEPAIIDTAEFMQAAPSIESYSPQTAKPEDKIPDPKLNYIKNDRAPDRNSPKPFGKTKTNDAVSMSDAPVSMNFDDVPPAAPMRFSDTPSAANNSPMDFSFDDAPPPAPMRFDDLPPAQPMRYSDAPPASPMKYEDTSKAAPQKNDKKHLFSTKKSREAETMRKAEEVVHNRKDIPNDGTWTCPNCGKVMPKYVGTCGCGESQPFDF